MDPWERRFGNLLCTFILNAAWLLSNLRPWVSRCFHSPSWHQVTADCGCGPVLQETPAGALTGWTALCYYCGDWWRWRKWPHQGLGYSALKETHTDRKLVPLVLTHNSDVCVIQDHLYRQPRSENTPLSLQTTTCSLTPTGEDRANKHTGPSTAAIYVAQPRPRTAYMQSL